MVKKFSQEIQDYITYKGVIVLNYHCGPQTKDIELERILDSLPQTALDKLFLVFAHTLRYVFVWGIPLPPQDIIDKVNSFNEELARGYTHDMYHMSYWDLSAALMHVYFFSETSPYLRPCNSDGTLAFPVSSETQLGP